MSAALTEAQLQRQVVELAQLCRWRVYHTFDSRRSAAGFPDLVLVRPRELVFAELKSEGGQPTAAQREWLEDLRAAGQEAHLWRPADWPQIEARLKARLRERAA